MAQNIIKGRNLMLFDAQGKSIAYATNHTLSLSAESQDTSSKDHGVWGASEINKITWEITSENLYTTDAFDSLFDIMMTKAAVDVYFGLKAEADDGKNVVDGDYTNWSKLTSGSYKGKAFITSLQANAANGENATFSVTLTGSGKIERQPVTYQLTQDTAIVAGKTYYTRTGTSPNYVYTPVETPVASALNTYYEMV